MLTLSVGLLAFLTFLPVLRLGFLDWDDDRNFVQNLNYRGLGPTQLKWMFSTFQTGPYQPLSWMTLGLDYAIWGLNPLGYHLTNLILHALSAALLVVVVARLAQLRAAPAPNPAPPLHPYLLGAAVGILWAVHPLRVEPVAWVTERRELLCGVLTLLTLLNDLRGGRRLVTTLLGCAAMLAKATAVALPVMLIAIDIYRDQRYPRSLAPRLVLAAIARRVPLIAAAAVVSVLAVHGQRSAGTGASLEVLGIGARLVLYFNAVAFYFQKTLWPAGLTAFYPIPLICDTTTRFVVRPLIPTAATAAIATIALAILAVRARLRVPWLLPLIVVYLAAIAPVSGLVQVGGQYAADRYAYQPTWVVSLTVILAVVRLVPRAAAPRRLALAALALAILLAALSERQLVHWRDNVALWKRELQVFPNAAIGHFNLAVSYITDRQDPALYPEAESHLRRAVELIPSYTEAWVELADFLARTNRPASAIEHYATALQTKPSHLPAIKGLADLLWSLNRKPEAIEAMQVLVQYDAANENAHLMLAKALAAVGRSREAIDVLEAARKSIPAAAVLRRQLIWLLSTNPDPAIRDGKRAVALVESSPPPHDWPDAMAAAAAYAEVGQFARAAELLDAVIPGLPPQPAAAIQNGADQFRRREPMRAPPVYP